MCLLKGRKHPTATGTPFFFLFETNPCGRTYCAQRNPVENCTQAPTTQVFTRLKTKRTIDSWFARIAPRHPISARTRHSDSHHNRFKVTHDNLGALALNPRGGLGVNLGRQAPRETVLGPKCDQTTFTPGRLASRLHPQPHRGRGHPTPRYFSPKHANHPS